MKTYKLLDQCNTEFINQFDRYNDTTGGSINWSEFYEYKKPYEYQPYGYKIDTWITETIKKPKKGKNMKNLYHVIVVTLDEEILVDKKVVAENNDDAKFLAKVFNTLEQEKLKPTEVTILVNQIGSVKVRKQVKTVKIIEK